MTEIRRLWPGRLATCDICRKVKFLEAGEHSDWRFLVLTFRDGRIKQHAVCPAHFPANGAPAVAWANAYARVFAALKLRVSPEAQIDFQSTE